VPQHPDKRDWFEALLRPFSPSCAGLWNSRRLRRSPAPRHTPKRQLRAGGAEEPRPFLEGAQRSMRRAVLLLATMALALLLAGGVTQAIINGEPDTGPKAHPYVGALVTVPPSGKFKGQRVPVCSGTLISARVFLTAGHCTDLLIKEHLPTYVSFDPTYKPGSSEVISATPHTHPKFCIPTPDAKTDCTPQRLETVGLPRDVRYDVGVAVLDKPVSMATYGALPKAGLVGTLKEGQRLTVVGYGVSGYKIGGQPSPQLQPVFTGERNRATVGLLDPIDPAVGDQLVKTSGIGIVGGGEGACNGDSGGPLFVADQQTIVGVTSAGIVPLCRGPGYYQRMDLPRVLSWVRSFP
jgi:Trypsin